MKERELNRANIGVAKTTAMSGRATAEESKRDVQTGSQRPRIVSLTVSWCFIAAGLLVAVARCQRVRTTTRTHVMDARTTTEAYVPKSRLYRRNWRLCSQPFPRWKVKSAPCRRPTPVCRMKSTAYKPATRSCRPKSIACKQATPRCRASWPTPRTSWRLTHLSASIPTPRVA